jgi:hypothetical protein
MIIQTAAQKIGNAPIDLVKTNRASAQLQCADNRALLISQRAKENMNHRKSVAATREKQEEARVKALESRMALKNPSSRPQSKAGDKLAQVQQMQDRWFMAAALASRLEIVKEFLVERHKQREALMLYTHSALVIQRKWKEYWKGMKMKIEGKSYVIIRRMFATFVVARREKKRHEAADLIRKFSQDVVSPYLTDYIA